MYSGKVDISLKEYHSCEGWSKSKLDQVNTSVAHHLYKKENPTQTEAMIFGSVLHCLVLTPEIFATEFAILPVCDRRTKEGKEVYANFVASSGDKQVISLDFFEQATSMRNAIFGHKLASQLLRNGEAEKSFFWTDERTKMLCKCRPDYLRDDGICIDVKSTNDASFRSFQKSIFDFRYHVQAAYFSDGVEAATGSKVTDFVLIVVEKEPPYGIMVYILDDNAIEKGREEYRKNLDTIVDWSNNPDKYKTVYPISEDPIEISLPYWAE
jgi:hypothetical protein